LDQEEHVLSNSFFREKVLLENGSTPEKGLSKKFRLVPSKKMGGKGVFIKKKKGKEPYFPAEKRLGGEGLDRFPATLN